MRAQSWLKIAKPVTEVEKPEVGASLEEIPIQLSFPVLWVFLCLCAIRGAVWFLL